MCPQGFGRKSDARTGAYAVHVAVCVVSCHDDGVTARGTAIAIVMRNCLTAWQSQGVIQFLVVLLCSGEDLSSALLAPRAVADGHVSTMPFVPSLDTYAAQAATTTRLDWQQRALAPPHETPVL